MIEWDIVPNAPGITYQVYKGLTPDIKDMEMIVESPTTKRANKLDRYRLEPGVIYYYRVRALYDSRRKSDYSEADSGYIVNVALPPSDSLLSTSGSSLMEKDTISKN